MSANLIGTVGSWGIASAESNIGIIIEGIDETTRNEKNYIKDIVGQRVGRSDYDESIEVKLSGKVTSTTPFSTKLGANITLSNTIASNSLQTNTTGRTVVNEVKRTAGNEDWKGIEVDIEILPFFT
jgi:hypothetical protein